MFRHLLTLTRLAKTDSSCQICQLFQFRHCVNDDRMMEQWSLTQNQPLLKTIYLKRPIISYKRGKSLKDRLVRSKITVRQSCEPTAKTTSAPPGLLLTYSLFRAIRPLPIAPENAGNRISEALELKISGGPCLQTPQGATAFGGRFSEPPLRQTLDPPQ